MFALVLEALVGAAAEEVGVRGGKALFRQAKRLVRKLFKKSQPRRRRAPRRRSTRKGGRQ
jgi:hypothetical protein